MQKIKYRIHFKSGLSIDIEAETDKATYADVWKEILNQMEDKPRTAAIWNGGGGSNNKFYLYSVNDIVCFETLK